MQPRPSREWVMAELERLGIRIVNGRKNTGKDEDDGDAESSKDPNNFSLQNKNNNVSGGAHSLMAGSAPDSLFSSTGVPNDFSNGINSSSMPPHRPMVGGGAAAAYEAAREDHYKNLEKRKKHETAKLSTTGGQVGLSANHKQHYEMLKLHHMNLLKEIQETTLMMNVYQQQEERQREQEEMQKKQAEALLMNGNQLHPQQGLGNQLNSLGFQGGVNNLNSGLSNDVQALLQQQQQQQIMSATLGSQGTNVTGGMDNASLQQQIQSLKNEIASSEDHQNGKRKREVSEKA